MDPRVKAELIKSLNLVQLIQVTTSALGRDDDDGYEFAFRMGTLVNTAGTEMVEGVVKCGIPSVDFGLLSLGADCRTRARTLRRAWKSSKKYSRCSSRSHLLPASVDVILVRFLIHVDDDVSTSVLHFANDYVQLLKQVRFTSAILRIQCDADGRAADARAGRQAQDDCRDLHLQDAVQPALRL